MPWTAEVLVSMMIWINSITGLPIPDTLPKIVYSDGYTMKRLLYGCDIEPENFPEICENNKTTEHEKTIGLYDHYRKVIHLNPQMNKYHILVQNSVIIHELVHHMQFAADVPHRCFGELEKLAYETQSEYLLQNGRKDVVDEMDLSPLYLMMIYSCPELSTWGVPGDYIGTD